jgi:hypothetical protein
MTDHKQTARETFEQALVEFLYQRTNLNQSEAIGAATEFMRESDKSEFRIVRTENVSIPSGLAADIEFILDLDTVCRTEFSDAALDSLRFAIAASQEAGS